MEQENGCRWNIKKFWGTWMKNAWENIPELELDIYHEEPLPEVDEDEKEDDLEFENDYVYDDYNDDE